MPATLEITDSKQGFAMVCTGKLTFTDIFRIKQQVLNNPSMSEGVYYWLVDLRGVTEIDLTSNEVHQIVDIDRRIAQKMPDAAVAVVAPTDVAFGVSRMWEILAEGIGWPTGVFREISDAKIWVQARTQHQKNLLHAS